ncbi:NAD-dependent epimerase/dehydratase family protein [Streptomyces sp. H27-S2]|uniref:NAD-dependent epimerase/dehydratase family protein n=1 Tax=Streptomyces antarcticus TaxID=2996458 RepID=UPI00226DC711|nr:NAD-dependent epimerase/dehydratase family protein [Streptomyces sp. H27-S2]MCY0955176.1 NAD-dependent epimerase/dehydratase family protein [Streptomyces sp. H27-S2]
MTTIMITGAAGFVGRHVTREAERRGVALRLMSHRSPLPGAATPSVPDGHAVVRADLADPASLRGACDGVDVLVHCAAQIGGTAERCEAVNARGTAALVAEARRAGVSRVVHLSTASVYGRGTFRGQRPEDLVRRPGSPTSASRAAAEDAVLAAGGTVLRPHLVYGEGDCWVVPGMARLLRALPGTVEGWSSRTSVIAVTDLARAMVATALAPAGDLTASVYHAAHPRPVVWNGLLRAVADCAALPWPRHDLTAPQARALLAERGGRGRELDMITTDHWFDSVPFWSDLGCDPGPGFPGHAADFARWYGEGLRTV